MTLTIKILLIINLLILIYTLFQTFLRVQKIINKQQKINTLHDELVIAINNSELVKENLIQEVTLLFGEEVGEQVAIGTIWEGMPTYLLHIALGKPQRIEDVLAKDKNMKLWYYADFTNLEKNYKYGLEIIIENNRIVKWDEQKVLN
jgi:hypothetical protein